MFFET